MPAERNSTAGPIPSGTTGAVPRSATDRDWAFEPQRIAWTYPQWTLGKKTTGPGWIAQRTFWDGATISIEAPDLIVLETRLLDQLQQERRTHLDPLAWPAIPPRSPHSRPSTI